MTNNTNNQEWWMKELPLLARSVEVGKQGAFHQCETASCVCECRQNEDMWRYELVELMDFIRKVSQQSREDALKECIDIVEEMRDRRLEDMKASQKIAPSSYGAGFDCGAWEETKYILDDLKELLTNKNDE